MIFDYHTIKDVTLNRLIYLCLISISVSCFCYASEGETDIEFLGAESVLAESADEQNFLDDSIDEKPVSYDLSPYLVSESELVDAIEKLQARLDSLTQEGDINASAAFMATGVLATIIFAIVHSSFKQYFDSAFYIDRVKFVHSDYINAALVAILVDFLPGAGLGVLLNHVNDEGEDLPRLPAEESVWTGLRGVIYSSGLWLAGYSPIRKLTLGTWFVGNTRGGGPKFTRYLLMWSVAVLPAVGYALYMHILKRRDELQKDIFDIKTQLKEARDVLKERQAQIDVDLLDGAEAL